MGLEPTHAEHIGKFLIPLTPRKDLKTRSQLSVKWIGPIKKRKQSCFASNIIVFFAQNKKKYQIKPLFDEK